MKAEITIPKNIFPMGVRRAAARAMGEEWVKIIRQRTAQGQFAAAGSSGSRARRYNEDYARQKGVPLSPVTLRDTGAMLNNMRYGYKFDGSSIIVGIMFEGAAANSRFSYHQIEGSGKNRILRRFVYANNHERRRIMRAGIMAVSLYMKR